MPRTSSGSRTLSPRLPISRISSLIHEDLVHARVEDLFLDVKPRLRHQGRWGPRREDEVFIYDRREVSDVEDLFRLEDFVG